MNLITRLQENEKPFGLMSEEMQAWVREHKKESIWLYYNQSGGWCNVSNLLCRSHSIYRLRPDYESPKPETVECEVRVSAGLLKYTKNPLDSMINANLLTSAMLDPDFIGFKYEDERSHDDIRPMPLPRLYMDEDGNVFSQYKEGYEVLTPTHVLFMKAKALK